MIHKRALVDILAEVVADLPTTISIGAVTDNGDDTYTFRVDDLKWAEIGREVTIDGNTYTITDIDEDAIAMTVSGTQNLSNSVLSFDLYSPYFFFGTPIDTNSQLADIRLSEDKTPMVWLLMKFRERFNTDDESSIERESTVSLFFLTQASFDQYHIPDMYDRYIRPMRRFQECFINYIQSDYRFEMTDFTYDVTDQPRFGVYITNKGAVNSWFADSLSGVQMDATFRITKTDDCEPIFNKNTGVGFDQIEINFEVQ